MAHFRRSIIAAAVAGFISVSAGTAVLAHHSPSAFNIEKDMIVTGTITKYSFRNPHVYIELAVEQDDGSSTTVDVEAGAGSVIGPLGFTRDAVAIGDKVTVTGNPGRRRPDELMLGRELYKEDGSYLPLNISSRSLYEDSDETSTSIEGTWFAPRTSFFGFLGNSSSWPLTEKGKVAMASTDPLDTPQKDCIPLASPALMFYPVANTITVEEDRVVLNVDWMNSERIVYMDGRAHPDDSVRSLHGHSTGKWDGDALVIETTNYTEHPMGLAMALPGGLGKHLTERIELNADGKGITYSGVIIDPEYLSEPVAWTGQWLYRPQMEHSNETCDLEIARRFLDD